MRKTFFLALLPALMSAVPAQACVSEVPTISVQDMSNIGFGAACVVTLMALGFMHLPGVAKAKLKQIAAVSFLAVTGLLIVGSVSFYASPVISSFMQPPASFTPEPTVQPNVQPVRVAPVPHTVAPLMVSF